MLLIKTYQDFKNSNFYTNSFLGYQLTPIRANKNGHSKNKISLILLYNIAFTVVVCYVLIDPFYDPYYVDQNLTQINELYKPLLGTVIQLDMLIFYPISHLLYKSHFAFYGREVVRLLDAAEMRNIRRPRFVLLKVVLLLVITYILLHDDILLQTVEEEGYSLTSKFLKVVTSLSVYVDMYFTYGIVLYFKLAMKQKMALMVDQTVRINFNLCDKGV